MNGEKENSIWDGVKEKAIRNTYKVNGLDCSVKGCDKSADGVDELLPFDPVDHDETIVALCESHQQWAEERNAFAEAMTEELRQARREIGQEHIDEIQRLAIPQGTMEEDILMGENRGTVPLADVLEEPL